MPYPLVLAPNGEEIMRINHDGSISAKWDRVLHYRYVEDTPKTKLVWRVCELVLAARDNFVQTAWVVSDDWKEKWNHFMVHLDYAENAPSKGVPYFTVTNGFLDVIACINRDGKWSIDWPRVEEVARAAIETPNVVTVVGFCRLLVAGQYRFRTEPWTPIALFGDDAEDDC